MQTERDHIIHFATCAWLDDKQQPSSMSFPKNIKSDTGLNLLKVFGYGPVLFKSGVIMADFIQLGTHPDDSYDLI